MADDIKKPLAEAVADVKQEVKAEASKAAAEITVAVIDELKKEKEAAKAEAVAWYSKLPSYGKMLVLVAAVLGYFAYEKFVAIPAQPVVINVQAAQTTAPAVVGSATDKAAAERLDGLKLLARILRHQTQKELQETGVEGKKLTREQAATLVDNFEDEHLVVIAQMSGVFPAEGKFLDTVTAVLTWVLAHKSEIKKIVELIIMLLAAFM